jgi:hypothetical protein
VIRNRYTAFRNLTSEEREKINMDNNMCPLCLRHRADQESHGKDIEKKPMCHDSECKEQPTESPHDPMTRGPVTMNEMEGEEDKEDE